MTTNDERHPRDLAVRLETAAGYLADDDYAWPDGSSARRGEIADDLRNAAELFASLRELAGLVSTAAAKHTGAAARARRDLGCEGLGATLPEKIQINGDAVGRLHNAAKIARLLLDGGGCAMCADAADGGVDVTDRAGTCAECDRVLGLL